MDKATVCRTHECNSGARDYWNEAGRYFSFHSGGFLASALAGFMLAKHIRYYFLNLLMTWVVVICFDAYNQSVSRRGNPYDNAVAESFFKTLKRELVKGRNYGSQEEARQEVFKYIELYYNTKRMHSYLGYMSPARYECIFQTENS